jgi:MFS family permease
VPPLPKSPRLRRILLAYTVNELGTWFGYVALAVGVYDHTHSAIATAGLFVSGRLLPALLTPALVARVESSERRGMLSALYIVEALTAAALAVLLWHFLLVAVLILVAVDGTAAFAANALLRAAAARAAAEEVQTGIAAPIVMSETNATAETSSSSSASSSSSSLSSSPYEQAEAVAVGLAQRKANAALNVSFTVTLALGPALAAVLLAILGGPAALLIDAASFAACGILLLDLRPHVEEESAHSIRARLAVAWAHLRAVPQLRILLITQAVAIVLFTSVEPVEVIFTKTTLNAGDRGFGLLMAAWGAGMVLGGIVFARSVLRPLKPMLIVGTLLVGLAYLGFAAAPTLGLACAAAIFGGAGNGVQVPALISSVQQLTPSALQGRLMSAVSSMMALCPAIGFALGGAVTELSSPRTALLLAGVASTAATLAFVRISLPGAFKPGLASAKVGHLTHELVEHGTAGLIPIAEAANARTLPSETPGG